MYALLAGLTIASGLVSVELIPTITLAIIATDGVHTDVVAVGAIVGAFIDICRV